MVLNAYIPLLEFSKKWLGKLRMGELLSSRQYAPFETLPDEVINGQIAAYIAGAEPSMIARFGVGELQATIRYAHMINKRYSTLAYLFGQGEPGWWTDNIKTGMPVFNGFFPATNENLERFGERMLADLKELDILGCWQKNEPYFEMELAKVKKARLAALEPYFHAHPWSAELKGKTVLIIHPFEKSIRQQYAKRKYLFEDAEVLPDFELKTIKAVQTLAGNTAGYANWFDALQDMENQMEAETFDVAIIGAGAYGFPLAAKAKRLGKIGIQLGGATQILFGIKGQRWVEKKPNFHRLFNEHWIFPHEDERPANAEKVEGACYW